MRQSFFICALFCFVSSVGGMAQPLLKSGLAGYTYHPPSEDKESWQRLNLWLSSTYLLVVREGQADQDVCLLNASRSLGLSRLSILAEGIDDPELTGKARWIDQQKPDDGIRTLSQAKGKQHAELLVLLGAYYAFQPNNYRLYKDSVEYFLSQAIKEAGYLKEEGLKRQAYCLLTKMYFQANEVKKADSIFIPLIKKCQADDDKETEARAFEYRGIYEPFSRATFQSKMAHMQKAADLYHELQDVEGEINALTDVGYLLAIMNRTEAAYDVLLKALALEESINYPYVHYNTDILAFTMTSLERFGEAFKYAIQSVKTAEATRDSIGWAGYYSRMTTMYYHTGREKETSEWRKKAFDRYLRNRDPQVYLMLAPASPPWIKKDSYQANLALISDVSKKVPAIAPVEQLQYHSVLVGNYIGLGEFGLAERHLAKADSFETILESLRGPLRRQRLDLHRASIHLLKGEFYDARLIFEKYFMSPSPAYNWGEDNFVYQSLIYLDSAQGDLKAGMAHYKKYLEHQAASFEISTVRQADELEVIYEMDEKEKEIALLNQQALFEQANLRQATLVKNLTIGGIVGALVIAGLLYRQSMLRKKNNAVITFKNEQLQHFLTEKEWLLKEIHHRVKNNLQIVMSLLNSQSAYIDNEPALTAIHDSQHRVYAMSLIHQKLYGSENVSTIDMSLYIRELVSYLADSFNTGQRIRYELDLAPLVLDVSQAVPLGLILNEAITNSIKYAFPDGTSGVISVALSAITSHEYLLNISDNGIGIPSNVKNKKPGSLGMSLIAGLAEDLDGKVSIENNNGTTIKIAFVHDQCVKRPNTLAASLISSN
jgi:two-component system, sensor histidine kinase PdtaS